MAGGSLKLKVFSGTSCEISQFWQNLQSKLHPAVAREKEEDPGRT
jgi:hypothetical protein